MNRLQARKFKCFLKSIIATTADKFNPLLPLNYNLLYSGDNIINLKILPTIGDVNALKYTCNHKLVNGS